MKTKYLLLLAALLIICLSAPVSAQQDNGVLLEYKTAAGGVNYILTVDSDSFFTLYGLEKKIKQNVVTEFTMGPGRDELPVKGAAAYLIEIIDEKIVSDGEKVDSRAPGSKLNLKLTKAGKIIDSSDPSKLQYFQDLIISFPEKPVKKGDSWKVETPLKIKNNDGSSKELTAVLVCKVEDFKEYNGKNCAVIETKLSVADEKTDSASLKASAAGVMHFDYENGRIAAINNVINMDVKVLDEKMSTKKPVEASTLKSKITVKLNLKK
jgi:hypothetical protein